MTQKSILLTILVSPLVDGKRNIVVTGAPEGEIPVFMPSTFAQMHQAISAVWSQLAKREPQVPSLVVAAAKPAKKTKDKTETIPNGVEADTTSDLVVDEATETSDQLVASEDAVPTASKLTPLEQAIEAIKANMEVLPDDTSSE